MIEVFLVLLHLYGNGPVVLKEIPVYNYQICLQQQEIYNKRMKADNRADMAVCRLEKK